MRTTPSPRSLDADGKRKIRAVPILAAGYVAGLAFIYVQTISEGVAALAAGCAAPDVQSVAFLKAPGGLAGQAVRVLILFVQCAAAVWVYSLFRLKETSRTRAVAFSGAVFWILSGWPGGGSMLFGVSSPWLCLLRIFSFLFEALAAVLAGSLVLGYLERAPSPPGR